MGHHYGGVLRLSERAGTAVFAITDLLYAEGIHILYSTNTIRTESRHMILHLPQLILRQRLESIRSVEIVWELEPFSRHPLYVHNTKRPLLDMESFEAFMAVLPTLFPNLDRLYIALRGRFFETRGELSVLESRMLIIDESVVSQVDIMVRRLDPRVDCSVAFPVSVYAIHRQRAKLAGWNVVQRHETGEAERLWRPLDSCLPRTGYWFCMGERDVRQLITLERILGHEIAELREDIKNKVFFERTTIIG
ncbi:hypothetical protein ACJ41O_007513 [Fusarium nematophilum]